MLPYPDLLLLRCRLLRRLAPRLSIMGSSQTQMGGLGSLRSGGMSLTRMMMSGLIGMVLVPPARSTTGTARPGSTTTLALVLVCPPDGGMPIRRERLMAASTGRALILPMEVVPGMLGGVFPRLLLQVRRLGRFSGGMRGRGCIRPARTSVRLTRGGRAMLRLVGVRQLPPAVHHCGGTGPGSPLCLTPS